MNQTGIIRKIDELGRIVLPKELRKYLNINPGDDFQIILNGNKIILEKYSYLSNYKEETIKIINSFSTINSYDISLVINNEIVNKNNIKIKNEISNIIKERKIYINEEIKDYKLSDNYSNKGKILISPIVINSDLLGAIIIIASDNINNIIMTNKIINNLIKSIYL